MQSPASMVTEFVRFDSLGRLGNRIPPALRLISFPENKPLPPVPGNSINPDSSIVPQGPTNQGENIESGSPLPILSSNVEVQDQMFLQYTTESFRPKRLMTKNPSPEILVVEHSRNNSSSQKTQLDSTHENPLHNTIMDQKNNSTPSEPVIDTDDPAAISYYTLQNVLMNQSRSVSFSPVSEDLINVEDASISLTQSYQDLQSALARSSKSSDVIVDDNIDSYTSLTQTYLALQASLEMDTSSSVSPNTVDLVTVDPIISQAQSYYGLELNSSVSPNPSKSHPLSMHSQYTTNQPYGQHTDEDSKSVDPIDFYMSLRDSEYDIRGVPVLSQYLNDHADELNSDMKRLMDPQPSDNFLLFSNCVFGIDGFLPNVCNGLHDLLVKLGAVVVAVGKNPLLATAPGQKSQCLLMLPMACPAILKYKNKYKDPLCSGELQLVTDNWAHSCIESSSILDPKSSAFYEPRSVAVIPYLEHVVIAISGFSEQNEQNIRQALRSMGAQHPLTNFRSTSDILVANHYDEETSKRALAWGVRITTIAWVEAMLISGEYELPREFLVPQPPKPLDGVIMYATETVEINDQTYMLARSLGARIVSRYSPRCTHVLHTGPNDQIQLDLAAHHQNLYIVSPVWLSMTLEANLRLPESEFPSTFIPHASMVP